MKDDLDKLAQSIGGHAAASIAGLHPFLSPMRTYARLRARLLGQPIHEDPPSPDMLMGLAMEPALAQLYKLDVRQHEQIFSNITLTDPANPWRNGHPDGIWYEPASGLIAGGVDYKNTSGRHKDARWDDGQAPAYVRVQANWYMDLAGQNVNEWDIWVSIQGRYPDRFVVYADPDFQAELVKLARRFIVERVLPGIPPNVDETEDCSEALRAMFPVAASDKEVVPAEDPELVTHFAQRYEACKDGIAALEKAKAHARNELTALIGDRYGISAEGWRVTWASVAARKTTDWDAVVGDLMGAGVDPNVVKEIINKNTRAGSAGRMLRVSPPKSGNGEQ